MRSEDAITIIIDPSNFSLTMKNGNEKAKKILKQDSVKLLILEKSILSHIKQ